MAQEPRTVQLGQHFLAFVKWKKHDGQPLDVRAGELPEWASSNRGIVTCSPSQENPGAASCQAIGLGNTTLTAIASFDTDRGAEQGSATLIVTVTDSHVAPGEIILSVGIVAPVGEQK